MKRLVVCCDGTWNAADSTAGAETNVFRTARAIHATHGKTGTQQVVLYLRGVGTTGLKIGDMVEGAFGVGIGESIRSAYMFLAQNYQPGDEIFLFGFSRGAFTARSVVGFIHTAGLLQRSSLDLINNAWAIYRQKGVASDKVPAIPLSAVHQGVEIKFLGVWDTVGALGVPGGLFAGFDAKHFGFHSTDACSIIRTGCHALAIDEHRDTFVPALWTGTKPDTTTIHQTWFAGAHSDVGGGYKTRALANIPLAWMVMHAEEAKLEIDRDTLVEFDDALDALAPAHDSRTGFFEVDKLRPTWRRVCEKSFHVSLADRLYYPMDGNGNALATINERVHASVAERFNKAAKQCSDDVVGTSASAVYAPLNIETFADQARQLTGMPVDAFAWPAVTPVAGP